MDQQEYCVAAEDRDDNIRRAITGPMSQDQAEQEKQRLNADTQWRLLYRYFHVAKYPYRPKRAGG